MHDQFIKHTIGVGHHVTPDDPKFRGSLAKQQLAARFLQSNGGAQASNARTHCYYVKAWVHIVQYRELWGLCKSKRTFYKKKLRSGGTSVIFEVVCQTTGQKA